LFYNEHFEKINFIVKITKLLSLENKYYFIFSFVDTPENSEESPLKLRFIYVIYLYIMYFPSYTPENNLKLSLKLQFTTYFSPLIILFIFSKK